MGLFSGIGKIVKSAVGGITGSLGITGGDLFSGGLSLLGGQLSNASNASQASKNRAFQQYNSDTMYQRAAADMRAAGLNPILAAGSGASTPSGSTASVSDAITPALSSAVQSRRVNQEAQLLQAQIKNIEAQTNKTNVDAVVASKNVPLADAQNEVMGKLLNFGRYVIGDGHSARTTVRERAQAETTRMLNEAKGKK